MFLMESLAIEGIYRPATEGELSASVAFMSLPEVALRDICAVQEIYAPGMPLRTQAGMNVCVGKHVAPRAGMAVAGELGNIAYRASAGGDPWKLHCDFERLHPFMDGNGRTGRILWAWCMKRTMERPFALPFLQRFYYQTLGAQDARTILAEGSEPAQGR